MVKSRIDYTGMRKHNWTVIKQVDDLVYKGHHESNWLCRCDCGTEQYFTGHRIAKNIPTMCSNCRETVNRKYDLSGECGVGYTSNTHRQFFFDKKDYDLIKNYTWYEKRCDTGVYVYSIATSKSKSISLHNLIMGKISVDHINRDPFDNRRENLRVCNNMENSRNRGVRSDNKSGVTGVYWNKRKNAWDAYIAQSGKTKVVGSFLEKEDAIRARLLAEKEQFGDFAPQKHLYEQYGIN